MKKTAGPAEATTRPQDTGKGSNCIYSDTSSTNGTRIKK